VSRPPQQQIVRTVNFIGEQDGPPERELKNGLITLFARLRLVRTASLVRVQYGDTAPVNIALCVRGQSGQDRMFAEQVGKIFGPIFGNHEHLDVIWLTPKQETALTKVCRPFYGLNVSGPQ
jgi:hypothetical protein